MVFKRIGKAAAVGIVAFGRAVPGLVADIVGLSSVGLISYGVWRIYEPAGFIAGGILMLAAVILSQRGGRN